MSDMTRALMTHTGQVPDDIRFARNAMQTVQNAPGNILKWAQQNPVDAGFIAASTAPVVGDAIGFGKDVYDMSPMGDVPFNVTNAALAGAGLLPFVPAGMGSVKKASEGLTLRKSTSAEQGLGPRQREGRHVYAIDNELGDEIGFLDVDDVTNGVARINDIVIAGKRDRGGYSGMKGILRQFRSLHPEVKAISGERVSGARRGGKHGFEGSGVEVNVPLMTKALAGK